jgi:hypothetical protein
MKSDRMARGNFHASGTWGDGIPDEEWEVYSRVIDTLQEHRIRIALGGAFALATYSGYWRNTKDLDFYMLEEDYPRVVELLSSIGLKDFYDVLAYDRGWIYRAHHGETIVDAIFGMPNRRAKATAEWLECGPEIDVRGKRLRVLPPEELIFAKIFVMQRPRCDWPDIINVIYGAGRELDWERLIKLLGEDVALLRGVLSTFAWIAPGRARQFPQELWAGIGLPEPEANGPEFDAKRVMLLESRPWFAPLILENERNEKKAA